MPFRLADSHARYDHRSRPTLIEVRCPGCGGRAVATEPCQEEGYVRVMEGGCPHWCTAEWKVVCSRCAYRDSGRSYSDLGELFYRVEARGVVLWAWNRGHLVMLHDLLSGRPVEHHRYAWFATYARRDWLKGSRKEALAKAVATLLRG
jgi:hypothetical protein